nr:hypothetical protein 1 [Bacillaceae bacterium]
MVQQLFFKVDINAIQNGVIAELGIDKFAVLTAIASFANNKGEAFPSQERVAKMVGYSRRTVVTKIQELQQTKYDGDIVLRIEQVKTAKGKRNKYFISPKVGLTFGNVKSSTDEVQGGSLGYVKQIAQEQEKDIELYPNKQEPKKQDIIFANAKAVLDYFRKQYFNKYNVVYQPNWGRDSAMIKNTLLKNFTDTEIKTIIDVVFDEYDKRWAKPQYPRPSIGQLCSWLGNKALGIAAQRKAEEARIANEAASGELSDDQFEKLLKEFE